MRAYASCLANEDVEPSPSLHSGYFELIIFKAWGCSFRLKVLHSCNCAAVAKLADALDLGSSAARRGGSSPSSRITLNQNTFFPKFKQLAFQPELILEKRYFDNAP